MKRIFRQYLSCAVVMGGALSFVSCRSQSGDGDNGVARGKIETAFYAASANSGVPVRMMLAVAYLESGLRPQPQSAKYTLSDTQVVEQNIAFGETAFGLSLKGLGLGSDPGAPSSLEVQVAAYGNLLKDATKGVALPPNAVTSEEKIRWIWRLAEIHRGNQRQNKNLLAIFSKEMIQILNSGFSVRDVLTGEIVTLEKEATPIEESQLPANFRQDLSLYTYTADIGPAYLFSLKAAKPSDIMNHPVRVEVIHCPLSLSACLNLQTMDSANFAPMGAHYVLPSSPAVSPGILQMARHDMSLELIDSNGVNERVTDRIVIMLTGQSGRYVGGIRTYANPMWLNDYQLRLLGSTVDAVCTSLASRHGVDFAKCKTANVEGGLTFRSQPVGAYRWGDISEFDEAIFYPYVESGVGLSATAVMSVEGGHRSIEAGTNFRLNIQFQPEARRVELERLVRCDGADQRVVWEAVDSKPVQNVSSKSIEMMWYDAGPNGNGDQFFRAKVTGSGGKFLGWALQQIQLKNFEKDPQIEGISKACLQD